MLLCQCKCIQSLRVPCKSRFFGTHPWLNDWCLLFPLQPIMRSHHYGRKKLCIQGFLSCLDLKELGIKSAFHFNPIPLSVPTLSGSSKSWLLQPAGKLISASLLLSCGKWHATSKESVQHPSQPSVWNRTKTHVLFGDPCVCSKLLLISVEKQWLKPLQGTKNRGYYETREVQEAHCCWGLNLSNQGKSFPVSLLHWSSG